MRELAVAVWHVFTLREAQDDQGQSRQGPVDCAGLLQPLRTGSSGAAHALALAPCTAKGPRLLLKFFL
eukprot:scaffold38417_cov20-Tisochrysis_lutea.AAC.3